MGRTIDLGTGAFMEKYNNGTVTNPCGDSDGRYSYKHQYAAGLYNLQSLRLALKPLFHKERNGADWNDTYSSVFLQMYMDKMRQKLGLFGLHDDCADGILIKELFEIMNTAGGDFTATFRDLSEISSADLLGNNFPKDSWALPILSTHKDWQGWVKKYVRRLQDNNISETERQHKMQAANPCYVLRMEFLDRVTKMAKENNDFSEIQLLAKVLENPFKRQAAAEERGYASKPKVYGKEQQVVCI